MGKTTKEELLDIGMKEIRQRGYDGVSIKDIVTKAGIPKGSFHYYFESKEAFGVELIEHFALHLKKVLSPKVLAPGQSAYESLQSFFLGYEEEMRKEGFKMSCLVGLISLVSEKSEALQVGTQKGFEQFQDFIFLLLQKAQKEGEIRKDLNAEALAAFLLNSWQGALLRMKSEKSDAPLRAFDQMVFGEMLKPARESIDQENTDMDRSGQSKS